MDFKHETGNNPFYPRPILSHITLILNVEYIHIEKMRLWPFKQYQNKQRRGRKQGRHHALYKLQLIAEEC